MGGAAAMLALVALAGCGKPAETPAAAAGTKPLVKVVFQTDWFAQPEHGGFYQALVKGYYRDAGLDVEIRQGNPTTIPAQVVATGRADFAMGRSDDVIIDAGRGVPLMMLGGFMQRDPQAILFHTESGIRGFKDLDGRNLMAVPGSPFITIMENTFHIKVAVTPTDFGMNRFLADKNFVQQCFLTNEPFYVRQHGANVGVLVLSDSGFSPYRVWYGRRDFVRSHPDIVRAFGAATVRGWSEYIAGDRTEANARIASLNPKMEPEFMAFSVHAMQEYHLITGDPAAGEGVGQISRERIETQLRQLAGIGLLDRPVTLDEVFDARLLPPASPSPAAK